MEKYCPDCRYYHMEFWYPNRCPHVGAEEKICDNFEWADERLEAGGRALRVLYYLSIDCYYNSTPHGGSFHRQLTEDMKKEYAACWEIMHGCEDVDNNEDVLL